MKIADFPTNNSCPDGVRRYVERVNISNRPKKVIYQANQTPERTRETLGCGRDSGIRRRPGDGMSEAEEFSNRTT